jgi:hypothetical protein
MEQLKMFLLDLLQYIFRGKIRSGKDARELCHWDQSRVIASNTRRNANRIIVVAR